MDKDMEARVRGRRAHRLAGVICAAVMAVCVSPAPPSLGAVERGGDSVSTPLTVVTHLSGRCGQSGSTTSWHRVAPDDASNRENWWLAISTADQAGTFKIETWVKNSYTKYTVMKICRPDHTRVRIMQPRVYVHKVRTVRYHCDPHCVPLLPAPVSTSDWEAKYCSSTGTKLVCRSF